MRTRNISARLLGLIVATIIVMLTRAAQAGPVIDVIMDTGKDVGGGGGNPLNGGIWQTGDGPNPSVTTGGVTPDTVTYITDNTHTTTATFSATDSASSAEWHFDLTLTAFNSAGPANVRRDAGTHAGVNGGDNRQINSAQGEFIRATVDNVAMVNMGTLAQPLEAVGIFGATIRTQTQLEDAGTIFEAGVGGTPGTFSLATWAYTGDYRQYLTFDPVAGIDVVPTADNANLQGLRLRFQEAAVSAIPEPSTFALAALGLLGLAFAGRRRRSRAA